MSENLKDFVAVGGEHGRIDRTETGAILYANAGTDWFFHPAGSSRQNDVPALCLETFAPVVQLVARVAVDFGSTYDAGALFVRTAADQWAKIAYERNSQAIPTIVSVVTRGTSDDSDGPLHPVGPVWLRVAVDRATVAMHYSTDGKLWHFLRFFALDRDEGAPVAIGLAAQSPLGTGCCAKFVDVRLAYAALADLRHGD